MRYTAHGVVTESSVAFWTKETVRLPLLAQYVAYRLLIVESCAAVWPHPWAFCPALARMLLTITRALSRPPGRPLASTAKKLTRFCDGWWKPQQPKGLPECGKFRRSPKFAFSPFGSPSRTEA